METVIVKLGGAAITNKASTNTISPSLDDLVGNVAHAYHTSFRPSGKKLVLIHGAGSFGHPPAKKYNVKGGWQATIAQDDEKAKQHSDVTKFGMAFTRQRVLELHHRILERLQSHGNLPVLSISTYDTVETDGGLLTEPSGKRLVLRVRHLLQQDFIPLLFGDAVLDQTWGCTILSGDALMHQLAIHMPSVQRCIFITDVAGIHTKDPKEHADAILIRRLHYNDNLDAAQDSSERLDGVDDVTGSMRSKWEWARQIMTEAPGISHVLICETANSDRALATIASKSNDAYCTSSTWTTVTR